MTVGGAVEKGSLAIMDWLMAVIRTCILFFYSSQAFELIKGDNASAYSRPTYDPVAGYLVIEWNEQQTY